MGNDWAFAIPAGQSYRLVAYEQPTATWTLKERIETLVSEWSEDTAQASSPFVLRNHAAFKELTDFGRDAVPHLLDLYRRHDYFISPILGEITKANPVAPQAVGNRRKIRKAWLIWGANAKQMRSQPLRYHLPKARPSTDTLATFKSILEPI